MKFLQPAVTLAVLVPLGECRDPLPDDTLVGVASEGNSILYERAVDGLSSDVDWDEPVRPIKIQSNVPVTVQRYDWGDTFDESDPLKADEGMVLVTSNCDTGATQVVPEVQIREEGGSTFIDVQLPGVPEASDMPFLASSSYDAVWYEQGCGWIKGTASPAYVGLTRPPQPTPSPVVAAVAPSASQSACLTEADCKEMQQKKAGFDSFYSGDYPTKGCFFKSGTDKVYWGRGGSVNEMSQASLPGVRKRLWCEKPGEKPPGEPKVDGACTTQDECDQKRLEMGVANFRAGNFPTKGCFSKGGNAFWGTGGSDDDKSKADLPGIQKRIWCDEISEVPEQCEIGPMASNPNPCVGGRFCQLNTGVCNNKSGIHTGTCEDIPEECIEIFQPVCGCDGNTYSNQCKAHAQGVNVSRRGKCNNGPGEALNTACLTEEECDVSRQREGIASFYSGQFATSTKGCFNKGGKAFFSEGTVSEMSEENLPGVQKRIWCNDSRAPKINSVLQKEQSHGMDITESAQVQSESAANRAHCFRPMQLLPGVVLANSIRPSLQSRALDTCTYNVEVLISGCNMRWEPASIEVAAPKTRTINSVQENMQIETYATHFSHVNDWGILIYDADYKKTVTLTFPEEDAVTLDSSADSYIAVPPFNEMQCSRIVCGRPFVDSHGSSLVASACSADIDSGSLSWSGKMSVLDSNILSAEKHVSSVENITEHGSLGQEWKRNALGEHASVASFAAFSIALMTNGAPSDLVEDSLKAALDEVRHARVSFDIASKLVGSDVGPGPLPSSSHHFNNNLTALAISVAKEGCVDETLSALAAAAEVEMIEDVLENGAEEGSIYFGVPRNLLVWIKNELCSISLDESNHSALAWRTLKWVCSVDNDACNGSLNVLAEEQSAAFGRHIGHKFKRNQRLLDQTKQAWTTVHTKNKEALRFITDRGSLGAACNEGVQEGRNETTAPLLSRLVKNIVGES